MIGCGTCGHLIDAHSDRAFVPCIINDRHPGPCRCPGYTERHELSLPSQYRRNPTCGQGSV